MSDLIQSVTNGVIEQSKAAAKENTGNNLGKEAFLKLLVTQMKYQDPLNPNTDTEFIAQLATFSQLEQLQNISAQNANSQAFSLVGKQVVVRTVSNAGNVNFISGRVDFVNMSGGKAKLSINGQLYSVDQLDSVIDDFYILEKGLPTVKDEVKAVYDLADPKNITFDVFMGEGETVANNVAVIINNTVLDAGFVTVSGNQVTVNRNAFMNYPVGSYRVTLVFNDPFYTTVSNKITVDIRNSSSVNPSQGIDTNEDIQSDDIDWTGVIVDYQAEATEV